jgi:hypothetical protein
MRRKLVAFGLFITWCTLVGIGSTSSRFAKSADFILLLFHLALLIVLSISRVWERVGGTRRGKISVFRRYLRWVTDDSEMVPQTRSPGCKVEAGG